MLRWSFESVPEISLPPCTYLYTQTSSNTLSFNTQAPHTHYIRIPRHHHTHCASIHRHPTHTTYVYIDTITHTALQYTGTPHTLHTYTEAPSHTLRFNTQAPHTHYILIPRHHHTHCASIHRHPTHTTYLYRDTITHTALQNTDTPHTHMLHPLYTDIPQAVLLIRNGPDPVPDPDPTLKLGQGSKSQILWLQHDWGNKYAFKNELIRTYLTSDSECSRIEIVYLHI